MLLNHSRHLARLRTVLFTATALVGLSSAAAADQFDPQRDPQIVIADPGTAVTDRDPVNVTGVGQMIIDEQNGFIGLCTGTLINPRTVIFAAHCVNERAASAYGAANGGQPIGFGFGNNNNAAGASAFGGWLNGISGGPKYQTNISRNMYNVSQVVYNPLSTEPAAASFLYGDVAMATLDTVAANVPTWNLMFSKLAAPTITAAGTGYHVVIDGYGNNGTGTTGSTGGIDFRRRVAANTLGALASLNDFEGFLFGVQDNLPQNLYWIDFDDPRRGTPQASPFDFNAWRDNAVPNEGITAAGDSGGPLILDSTFSKQVVLAVLSGGYTRFFNGQPANGYGTASFYQPLYLYWDWIAANNHYHYTAAVAGNGSWTDPAHWVTTLDPNYQVISNGQVVNGIPTTLGGQNVDTSGKFGQACFQSGGVSDCYDTATGVETIQTKPIGTAADGSLGNDMGFTSAGDLGGTVDQATLTGGASAQSLVDPVAPAPQAPGGPLPAATVANGLPGATNFVPNNSAGSPTVAAQYYDVTLSAAGTTTLSGATIVIDRLALQNSAGLDIQATGSLTSNIDVTMFSTSTLNVAGTLRTADLTMGGGTLTGTGTIVLNAGGTVFPSATALLTVGNGARVSGGTVGTAGTLTVTGNMLMALASTTVVDKSPTATDRINVSGVLGVNGTLLYSSVGGYVPQFTDTAVIASATTITGSFASVPDTVTGVLFPVVTKVTVGGTQQEVLSFQAASFLTQLTGPTADQTALANALDALRATNY
ncbi:MAG: autotransporter domain-containing protein, partial [Alphaproteobacteria bacterium]|nr:autotransporter domain-containing protein [Alphaproteobacteria bacterium]MBV9903375.1 autotransporter domain-containing protein [Alphaproteobacteria bacterium]